MPFAVEMFCDESADKRVREIWNDLAQAKLTSSMIDGGYRPHVTLGVFEGYTSPQFENELRLFAEKRGVFSIKFDYLGVFPRPEGVVYFGAVVTGQLLSVHGEFTRHFAPLMMGIRPYYLPGNWVPHCTLAYGLSMATIPSAVEVCSRSMLPIIAQVKEIGLVEIPKHREVLMCELGGDPRDCS
ncbi:MAG TPA: 2'-5' RNA ligase family protein [Verrucomicrobiae bacterium]|nr:2'-5' RNA ligase family protein [Verrucomicrobiae bacterium]